MKNKALKIMIFLKRRPGLSVEEFRRHYETVHIKLTEKYAVGLSRYIRKYVDPMPGSPEGYELPYDVVTELWFEDEAVFWATAEHLAGGNLPEDVLEDEKYLLDRNKTQYVTATIEYESEMAV